MRASFGRRDRHRDEARRQTTRWPLELADFIGLDTCLSIMQVLYEGLADSKYRPCPLLVKYVEAGWLGRKTERGFYDYRSDPPVPPASRTSFRGGAQRRSWNPRTRPPEYLLGLEASQEVTVFQREVCSDLCSLCLCGEQDFGGLRCAPPALRHTIHRRPGESRTRLSAPSC